MLSLEDVFSLSLVSSIVAEGLQDAVLLWGEGCLGFTQHHFKLPALSCRTADVGWCLAHQHLRSFLAVWSIMLAPTTRVMVQFCDSGWETPVFSSVLNPLRVHQPCRQL